MDEQADYSGVSERNSTKRYQGILAGIKMERFRDGLSTSVQIAGK